MRDQSGPRRRWRWAVVAILATAVACKPGFDGAPTGTLRAIVRDQANAPVAGVNVAVSETVNPGGTYFISQKTAADGTATFGDIQQGNQAVTITAPAGYTSGTNPNTTTVSVLRDQTIEVSFVLVKSAALR